LRGGGRSEVARLRVQSLNSAELSYAANALPFRTVTPMNNPVRRFSARKDAVGALLILAIFGIGGFLSWRSDLIPWPMADKFGWLFIVLGVLAWWDWMATTYEITQDDLVIRTGLGSQTMPLGQIELLQRRRGALRVKCMTLRGSRWLTLTPRDHTAFLQRLFTHCPWLRSA
jgi:hypothetical protein